MKRRASLSTAAGDAPHREAFPRGSMVAAAMLTLALFAGLAWVGRRSYTDLIGLVQTELRLRQLAGQIMQLDEVLTMSARMAAATGDLKWETRYRTFEPQLDAAIKEAVALAPEASHADASASDTDAANQALVRMEHEAFSLVRAARPEQARAILFSRDYDAQKPKK